MAYDINLRRNSEFKVREIEKHKLEKTRFATQMQNYQRRDVNIKNIVVHKKAIETAKMTIHMDRRVD